MIFNTDTLKGLYRKFKVTRLDGSSKSGQKHACCEYFVLDLNHDPFSMPALMAYISACTEKYPALAADLTIKLRRMEQEFLKGPFKDE